MADWLADLMPEIAKLPADQQQRVLDALDANPQFAPEMMPEWTEEQIGSISASRRRDQSIDTARGEEERARARQAAAQKELAAGVAGPNYVPSAWGPIAVRQSPLMNLVRAVKSFKGGQDVADAGAGLEKLYGEQEAGMGDYLRAVNEQNRAHNARAPSEAVQRIMRLLQQQGGGQ